MQDLRVPLCEGESAQVVLDVPQAVRAPGYAGQHIGTAQVVVGGKALASCEIVLSEYVESKRLALDGAAGSFHDGCYKEKHGMRLQKYMAMCGVAARRKCEEIIAAGRVAVNGETITQMGTQVEDGDVVTLDGGSSRRRKKSGTSSITNRRARSRPSATTKGAKR